MTDEPKKLSNTVRALLTAATTRNDCLIQPPQLPTAAARQVVRSLLNTGLVEEVQTANDDAGYAWRAAEKGRVLVLRATALGVARVTEGDRTSTAFALLGAVTATPAEEAKPY